MIGSWLRKQWVGESTGAGDGAERGEFPPEQLVIPHDEHHGRHVGHTADGDGFFITTPFTTGRRPADSREFVALYRFAPDGELRDAVIESVGSRAHLVGEARAAELPGNTAPDNPITQAVIERLLGSLGPVQLESIVAKPFRLERYGLVFGLIPDVAQDVHPGDAFFEPAYVTLLPGNYMAFMAPWDGTYDT
jgi:hypothetical protein